MNVWFVFAAGAAVLVAGGLLLPLGERRVAKYAIALGVGVLVVGGAGLVVGEVRAGSCRDLVQRNLDRFGFRLPGGDVGFLNGYSGPYLSDCHALIAHPWRDY